MKLTSIRIRNFAGLRSLDIETDRTCLFLTGLNGAGKSTVLQAIRMALFGRCYDAAGKRIVMADLVGPDGSKAVVTLTLDPEQGPFAGETIITTTIKRTGQQTTIARPDHTLVVDEPQTTLRDTWWGGIVEDVRHAELAANPRPYLLGDDIADLLLELCGTGADPAELRQFAGPRWPWLEGWLGGAERAEVEALADRAVAERKETKRQIADLRAVLDGCAAEQPKSKAGKPLAQDDIPALKNALAKVEADLRRAETDLEIARRTQGRPAPDLDALRAAVEKAHADSTVCADALQKAAQAKRDSDKAVASLEAERHSLTAERDVLTRQLGSMVEGTCETCGARWTEQRLKARREPLENRLAGVLAIIDQNQAKLDAAMADRNRSRTAEYEAQQAVRSGDTEIERARRNLQEGEAWEAPRDTAALETEVAKLAQQAKAGEELLAGLEAWCRAQETRARLDGLHVALDNLEWAVEAFRDGKFQATRMAGPREAFERTCNEALGRFGMQLRVVQRDGAVRVEVGRQGGPCVPVPQISKGERTLVEAVVALAYDPGAILCLDDLDALDGGNKQHLMDLLKGSPAMVVCAGAWGLRDRNLAPLTQYLGGAVVWVGSEDRKEAAA